MTKAENRLLPTLGIPVSLEVRNNDNSLAVSEDDEDRDNVREVIASNLSTGPFNNWRIMLMLDLTFCLLLKCIDCVERISQVEVVGDIFDILL